MNKSNATIYGIDAPNVIRNLFLASLATLLLLGFTFFIESPIWFWVAFLYLLITALSFFLGGIWTLYSSLILKPKLASRLIKGLKLEGTEKLLDVGCGRGLFLIEAAKHLPHGRASGIDLWFSRDQSRNHPDRTLTNAKREGVEDRIEIKTADMCQIPYPDHTFDCVISSLAIHNLDEKEKRHRALDEMMRVLKPSGKFLIIDIPPAKSYHDYLKSKRDLNMGHPTTIRHYCPPVTVIEGEKVVVH